MKALEKFPRVRLAQLPTSLEEMPRLTAYLGGPRIFIKRDDNTGLSVGGNKARKLEFALGDALRKGATAVITTGGVQSNHARMTAGAAAKLGLKCVLVLSGKEPDTYTGNLLLNKLLGAKMIFSDTEDFFVAILKEMEEVAEKLRQEGDVPYILPVGGATPIASLGYVNAVEEIIQQAKQLGIRPNYIIQATGSGGTQDGMIVGTKLLAPDIKVIGISVANDQQYMVERILGMAQETAQLVGLEEGISAEDVIVDDEYIGPGYTLPTPEMIEAVKLVAALEGIILDPVYTGKAMAGMIDLIKKGKLTKKDTVIFLHTGGYPGLFAFSEYFK